MRSADFEQFLREHSLDVNSVTSSISDAKTYVDTWSNTKTPEHNKFTSKITTDMTKSNGTYHSNYRKQHKTSSSSLKTEKLNSELNKLDNNLHLEHQKAKEFKEKAATSKFDYMNYLATIDNEVTKTSFYKMKRKMGIFKKKSTLSKTVEDSLELIALKDFPVEITILSLDDTQDFQTDKGEHAIYSQSPRNSTTVAFNYYDNSKEPPHISIGNDHEERVNSKDIRYVRKHGNGTHKFKPIKAVFASVSSKVCSTPKFVENKEISEKNNIQRVNNGKESVQTTVVMDNKTTASKSIKVDDTQKFENQLKQTVYRLEETNTETTKHQRHNLIKGITENLQHVFNLKYKTKPTTDTSTWSETENIKPQSNYLKSRESGYQYDGILDDRDSSKMAIDYDYDGPNKRYCKYKQNFLTSKTFILLLSIIMKYIIVSSKFI